MNKATLNDEHIRETAYGFWLEDGQPQGCEEEHWLRAVAALTAKAKPARKAAAKPRAASAAPKKAAKPKAKAAEKK